MFVAGIVATAATSPRQTRIDIPDELATLRLDEDQPAALARIVITLNAEATSTYSGPQFHVFVDACAADRSAWKRIRPTRGTAVHRDLDAPG